MVVHHDRMLWAIAVLVLLASVSFSESVKLRKPRKRTTIRTPYQQSRIGPVIIRMHKYADDNLARGASNGCIKGNCKNEHNKFNNVNKAMSKEDNFLLDEESLRYVVHPEKYEHFVLRKNTGHANRYKRDSAFSELHSSNTRYTVIGRDSDASKISGSENKKSFTKFPLYTIRYTRDLSRSSNASHNTIDRGGDASKVSGSENKRNIVRIPLYRTRNMRDLSRSSNASHNTIDRGGDASKVSGSENKRNIVRIPLYRTRNMRDLSRSSNASHDTIIDRCSDASKVPESENKRNIVRIPLYRTRNMRDLSRSLNASHNTIINRDDDASKVSGSENKRNVVRIPLYRTRNMRDLSRSSNASHNTIDRGGDASKVSGSENKRNIVRIPLYRTRNIRDLSKSSNEADRTIRSIAVDYFSRRNDSDYYAQRKAVMERYYARQREINARYANRTNVIPRLERNDMSQHRLSESNALFKLGRAVYPRNSTMRNVTFQRPSPKIDLIYSNESQYNKIPTELDSRRNVAPEIDFGFKSNADLSQTKSSSNIERNALDYFITPTPCTNLSSSGTIAPKTRPKHAKKSTSETEQSDEDCDDTDDTSENNDDTENNLRWGKCEGKIVYQHNLLLGLTGPSNLDALFEVIIQGPVCITCVEALRYNETRATVTLDSGGRGHEYAKLRLQGFENEGFSYIIKVWGINKTGQVCDNID